MATLPNVRASRYPDTHYFTFKPVKHSNRDGTPGDNPTDADTGMSPLSRWLTFTFTYADFESNPEATGHRVQAMTPPNTIALRSLCRVDTAFVGTGNNDIDVGDGNDTAGWGDGLDFSSTGGKYDPNSTYNPAGSTGFAFYEDPDTIDILFKNATAPTAGAAKVFLEVISYHEDLNEE
ncbi:MAG: hypothetical protein ACYSYL_00165 [Planctomycetota bacterium]|jgi:hypothetical protein